MLNDDDLRVTVYDDDIRVVVDAAIGINGENGAGVNPGGTTGQILVKLSEVDFDTTWADQIEGVPFDGTTDQVLTKRSNDPLDTEWRDVPPGVPDGGDTGQILAKASGTGFDTQWVTPVQAENVVSRSGDTMEGPLILDGDPVNLLGAATKQYADTKAPIISPAFSGVPIAPTPVSGTNTQQIATTEYVQSEFSLALPNYLNKLGGTMTGPITLAPGAPSLGPHAANKDYVDASPGNGPYALEFDTISRTNLSRWNDHLNIAEISPIDVTGVAATAHTAILGAVAKAIARNRPSFIHLPAGKLRFGAPVNLLNTFALGNQTVEIGGTGQSSTTIIGPGTGGHTYVFGIGANEAAQTGNIKLRDFTISPAGAVETAILMHNARNIDVINVRNNLCKYFLRTGTALGTLINSVAQVKFIDCNGNLGANGIMFYPNTLQILIIHGGSYTGGLGRQFLKHDSLDFNLDGIYIKPDYTEQMEYAVNSIGSGIVNLELTGGQWDRAITYLRAITPTTDAGSNRNWVIHNTQFLDADEDAIIWDASLGPGGVCEGLNISGVNFSGCKKRLLYANEGSGVMTGITARTCGYLGAGTELVRLGPTGNFEIVGLQHHITQHAMPGEYSPPTWGIVYEGPSTGKRGHTAVRLWEASLGTYTGTP